MKIIDRPDKSHKPGKYLFEYLYQKFMIMLGILNEQQIEEVLEKNITGRIGCTDGKTVYILPVTYLYDGKYIIAHSKEGLKIRTMREHPDVCFEVDEIQTQANWKSVLAWGKYEELKDQRERYYALDRLIRKIHKLKVSETALPVHTFDVEGHLVLPDEPKTIVYRIRIEKKSGRFEM